MIDRNWLIILAVASDMFMSHKAAPANSGKDYPEGELNHTATVTWYPTAAVRATPHLLQ